MTEPSTIAQAAQYLAQRYEARESMDIMLQPFAPPPSRTPTKCRMPS